MLNQEVVFSAGDLITPDLAAKIAQAASLYEAKVYMKYRGVELCVDSLIGILAMNVHRGSKVRVAAEGRQAEEAMKAVSAILAA